MTDTEPKIYEEWLAEIAKQNKRRRFDINTLFWWCWRLWQRWTQ